MSRMLEALRRIEAKQSRQPAQTNMSPVEKHKAISAPVRTLEELESTASNDVTESCDSNLAELHPIIQEELEDLRPSILLFKEPISSPPAAKSGESDAFADILARAESAAISALSPREPDIYEEMSQYILAQSEPGQSSALLFTSPGDCAEKTETLRVLSNTLVDRFHVDAFLLDAMLNKDGLQDRKMPYISGGWGHLFHELKTQNQLVLIDAPSLAHDQTADMVSQCDGVYLVIRLGYTTPYVVREAVRVIEQAGGRLLGSIAVDGMMNAKR